MSITGSVLYGQSGGPTSVINSSAYGVIKEAFKHLGQIENVYMAKYGIDGVIDDDLIKIDPVKDNKDISLLVQTPGAAFGSTRHKLKSQQEDIQTYQKILQTFKKHNIRFFLYNGGNDSMDTIYKLSEYFKSSSYQCYLIGIPKTIDNDLVLTDHCPGYGSSAKYIASAFSCLIEDASSYQKGRINIVEIMGRDSGYLTCSAALGPHKPDFIYIPEIPFDLKQFQIDAVGQYQKKGFCYIAISEGIKDKDGNLIAAQGEKDAFNHQQLGGVGSFLSNRLSSLGYKTRAIELSLVQRSASFIQSKTDCKEAIKAGAFGLRAALKGQSDKMVSFKRSDSDIYKISCSLVPLKEVAGQVKYLPRDMMNKQGNNITDKFISYASPLIQGEEKYSYKNGVIEFSSFLIK